ncbi:conserved hypothetical protein (plasmid) [Borreliella burgdorferi B31]|uniref:Uncharacterized protein n=1 Tax=Borreliella burgdorferi (strain ATCC 35210 / DSM 4680 / CIP 102532 / B31) TaxID=224326 RepID=Q9S033_BORBU|nr:DUF643 domain-containing protein [Borreliella burgdorferi]AAF07690.2 conserved hypothetical protein [Borreliella burgdorferi B31]
MHTNEISNFYDNLSEDLKKSINKLYETEQATQEQKSQMYSSYKAAQEYGIKTGKSTEEIINDIIDPTKKIIKDVLKNKYLIQKYKNSKNMQVDYSDKKGMLKKCLKKLGEYDSMIFLGAVYGILNHIYQKVSKQYQLIMINEFKDILFIRIHNYDKRIFTSDDLIKTIKDFP